MKQRAFGKSGDEDGRKFDLRFDVENQLVYFEAERHREVAGTKEWEGAQVFVDYDQDGKIIGVEIV